MDQVNFQNRFNHLEKIIPPIAEKCPKIDKSAHRRQ
jgi:hypothetical protein